MKPRFKLTGRGGEYSGPWVTEFPPLERWKLQQASDVSDPTGSKKRYWFEWSDGQTLRWWEVCTENG